MADYKISTFPKTRIATNDICAIGLQKHHIAAMIEIDVSGSREILNMTILIDHDVVDGGIMNRFISNLTDNLEQGKGL